MEIEELFDELEDLSDSGPELDTMSVSSTPKPSLRPFFSSSRSLLAPAHSGKSHLLIRALLLYTLTLHRVHIIGIHLYVVFLRLFYIYKFCKKC